MGHMFTERPAHAVHRRLITLSNHARRSFGPQHVRTNTSIVTLVVELECLVIHCGDARFDHRDSGRQHCRAEGADLRIVAADRTSLVS
jgi:hypothetical protein